MCVCVRARAPLNWNSLSAGEPGRKREREDVKRGGLAGTPRPALLWLPGRRSFGAGTAANGCVNYTGHCRGIGQVGSTRNELFQKGKGECRKGEAIIPNHLC